MTNVIAAWGQGLTG
ncbi:hypothetical protein KIPB_017205, partial [Kipferlia bialata]|eukprot:g17205.t1